MTFSINIIFGIYALNSHHSVTRPTASPYILGLVLIVVTLHLEHLVGSHNTYGQTQPRCCPDQRIDRTSTVCYLCTNLLIGLPPWPLLYVLLILDGLSGAQRILSWMQGLRFSLDDSIKSSYTPIMVATKSFEDRFENNVPILRAYACEQTLAFIFARCAPLR